MSYLHAEFEELLGQTILDIKATQGDDEIRIKTEGNEYIMYHEQDCCESVYVEDIIGDISDLIGSPVTMAEEVSQNDDEADESGTWTFYKLATIKGYVTLRWYGESNGYYSEDVDFAKVV